MPRVAVPTSRTTSPWRSTLAPPRRRRSARVPSDDVLFDTTDGAQALPWDHAAPACHGPARQRMRPCPVRHPGGRRRPVARRDRVPRPGLRPRYLAASPVPAGVGTTDPLARDLRPRRGEPAAGRRRVGGAPALGTGALVVPQWLQLRRTAAPAASRPPGVADGCLRCAGRRPVDPLVLGAPRPRRVSGRRLGDCQLRHADRALPRRAADRRGLDAVPRVVQAVGRRAPRAAAAVRTASPACTTPPSLNEKNLAPGAGPRSVHRVEVDRGRALELAGAYLDLPASGFSRLAADRRTRRSSILCRP